MNALPHLAVRDDEPDITRLSAGQLQQCGHHVTQLHDGLIDPPALVPLDLARRVRTALPCLGSCEFDLPAYVA